MKILVRMLLSAVVLITAFTPSSAQTQTRRLTPPAAADDCDPAPLVWATRQLIGPEKPREFPGRRTLAPPAPIVATCGLPDSLCSAQAEVEAAQIRLELLRLIRTETMRLERCGY